MLNSIHVSLSKSGGTSLAAQRFSKMESEYGYNSVYVNLLSKLSVKNAFRFPFLHLSALLDSELFHDNEKILFSYFRSMNNHPKIFKSSSRRIHIHWAPGLISPRNLVNLISSYDSIFVHMHDFWFVTGGCHMPGNCVEFSKNCRKCPIAKSSFHGSIHKSFISKHSFLSNNKVKILAPSQWIKDKIQNDLNFEYDIHVISNPVISSDYFYFSKDLAKKILGIPLDFFTIGFVANDLEQSSKGISKCVKLIEEYFTSHRSNKKIFLLFLGNGKISTSLPHKKINFTSNKDIISLMYSAMNIFANPSLVESFSYTNIESSLHKTPVISFSNGGSEATIKNGINGYVYKDNDELLTLLNKLLEEDFKLNELMDSSRKYVLEHFDSNVVFKSYLPLI